MISSREEFANYCLHKLGHPVIKINVAPEQIDDRIDEAIALWHEKHYDATEKVWIGYKLTADDILNGYITLPRDIHNVDKILPLNTIYNSTRSANDPFNYQYQLIVSNLSPFQQLDMIGYYLTDTGMGEIDDMLNTTERFEFTKHRRKLKIYRGMECMQEGDIVCIHAYKKIDPDEDEDAWNDKWLKSYATALIKQQFGQNMKKHGEIQLLGGVTVNGQQIFDEATAEIEKLEEELQETWMEPTQFFVG